MLTDYYPQVLYNTNIGIKFNNYVCVNLCMCIILLVPLMLTLTLLPNVSFKA